MEINVEWWPITRAKHGFVATPHNKYAFKKAGTSNRETGLVPAFLFMGWRTNGM